MTAKELREYLGRKFIDDDDVIQIAIESTVHDDSTFEYDVETIKMMGAPDKRIVLIGKDRSS